jgi:hypothetical protein
MRSKVECKEGILRAYEWICEMERKLVFNVYSIQCVDSF